MEKALRTTAAATVERTQRTAGSDLSDLFKDSSVSDDPLHKHKHKHEYKPFNASNTSPWPPSRSKRLSMNEDIIL